MLQPQTTELLAGRGLRKEELVCPRIKLPPAIANDSPSSLEPGSAGYAHTDQHNADSAHGGDGNNNDDDDEDDDDDEASDDDKSLAR